MTGSSPMRALAVGLLMVAIALSVTYVAASMVQPVESRMAAAP